ncbi:hypothetical protein [Streptomyces sp. Ru87]|uniref:hypothetical protein n=1 Tax=Streptomyces sp. Ru87 TaxID=2044307 RepID=UPI000BF54B5E|nr:hypothetical protein [Streptomyces sp. Ru87]PGH50872.1 hypothetical protein CRI70_09745 [Streptomyces sp. Ru87]
MTTAEPPPSGRDPEDRPALSEEDWAAFLRDLDGASRKDAPKEPSARARMVAERLRRLDEEESRGSRGTGAAKRRPRPPRRRTGRPGRRQETWRPAPGGLAGWFRANGTARAVVVFAGFLLVMLALSWLLGPARY